MANTYTQIHIQAIFAVQNRDCIIDNLWKDELYKYIMGIIRNNQHKPLVINGMPDHVHVLFGMKASQSLSDLMQDIKANSSKWINEKRFLKCRFSWQEGFGAFSYSKSQIPKVISYINNQEEHHKKKSFIEEYKNFLQAFKIDYDEQYIFKPNEF
ncbi:MAG: transposase [Candidatus Desantisbacteria bacterium]